MGRKRLIFAAMMLVTRFLKQTAGEDNSKTEMYGFFGCFYMPHH